MSGATRRDMVRGLVGLGGLSALGACTPWKDPVIDRTLPRPHGDVQGYRGLAETPWFDLDAEGALVLKPAIAETLPWATDFHAHLGFSFMFAPELDLGHESHEVQYLIDCDGFESCRFAFDDYLNKIATPEVLAEMERRLTSQAFPGGSDAARTHTIPNLVREMDRMKTQRAVLLSVVPKLPFRNNATDAWIEALDASPHRDRFVLFAGVHPLDGGAPAQLAEFITRGARGVKLHPPMQQFSPSDPQAFKVYEVCANARIPVFFHAGRAGIEPRSSRPFALMDNYVAPAKAFPELNFVFGHAGARDWEAAAEIAAKHRNVYLEIEGQGVAELQQILKRVPAEQILFGSDWPFYPLAATVARVLMATEDNPRARDLILAGNAERLLGPAA